MAVASYPLVKRRDQGRTNQIRAPFFPFPFIPFLSFHMFLFSFLPSLFPRELVSPQGMSFNVPRVPEVGDQREPIWAEALVAVAGYSLLNEEMFCRTGA